MIQQMKNTFFHKLWLDCRDHSKHINIPTDSAPCINYVCHILQTMQNTLECNYYPHVDRQGVDISVRTLLFVCFFCVFVRLRIAPASIKLAGRQILHGGWGAAWAGNLPFWGTLPSRSPKSDESAYGGARPRHVWITVSPLHWRYLLIDWLRFDVPPDTK